MHVLLPQVLIERENEENIKELKKKKKGLILNN